MNLILLEPEDYLEAGRVRLRGRRHEHVHGILRAAVGDELLVGELDGKRGRGRVLRLDGASVELEVRLDRAPPAALDIDLVLALPRPPSLRKVLQQATAMGVKRFWLIHSRRVEKSFWQSTGLEAKALGEQLRLGLEQAGDTVLPRVEFRRRFKPFVEDELREVSGSRPVLLADPGGARLTGADATACTLIVGPEGGFIPFEVDLLRERGARTVSLGERVLRVETAVVALLSKLI